MKKSILVSLAISAAMLLSTSTTIAASTDGAKNSPNLAQLTSFQLVPQEVTGTVEKISDNEMTVKVSNVTAYNISLTEFSKLADFQGLGLEVGTQVTVKMGQPKLTQENGTITLGEVKPAGAIGESKNLVVVDATKATNITLNPADAKEGEVVVNYVKVPEAGTSVIKLDELKKLEVGTNQPKVTVKNIELKYFGSITLIASEITANGKTVKLPE